MAYVSQERFDERMDRVEGVLTDLARAVGRLEGAAGTTKEDSHPAAKLGKSAAFAAVLLTVYEFVKAYFAGSGPLPHK